MDKFFHPQSIAIIGASEQKDKIGNILLRNLTELSFQGLIYPVNPKHKEIEGLASYSTVLDIQEEVDLAIIAIPAPLVPKAVEECAWKKKPIKHIIIISAGFSEMGEAGKQLETQLIALAKEHDLKILGPNCLGVVNGRRNINLSFSKNNFQAGNIGLVMQSGAFTTALFDLSQGEHFGFSLVATLGNKAVLDEVDFLEYYLQDPDTQVIGMYLEDIKRGKEFSQMLRKVSQQKPVVILKAGNSQKAQQAMMSHTGAMAGEAVVTKEAIMDNGGLYFDDLTDFVSALKVLSGFSPVRNNKLAIVTNAGGPGVIITDLVEKKENIHLIDFSDEQKQAFQQLLPPASSVENPIDLLGDADEQRYRQVLSQLTAMEEVGAVLAVVTPQAQTDISAISKVIVEANKSSRFPIFPIVIGSSAADVAESVFQSAEMGNFVYATGLLNVLSAMVEMKKPGAASREVMIDQSRQKQAQAIYDQVKKDQRNVFYYQEAKQLAILYQLNAVDADSIEDKKALTQLNPAYPVVMKVDSPELLHKNTKNGVILNIQNEQQLQAAYQTMRSQFSKELIIMQPQQQAGFEVIVGVKKDARFGHVLMVGLGGILTEILGKRFLWILPASRKEIEEKLTQSLIEKVFQKQKIEFSLLLDILEQISFLAIENQWISELDINPIIFYADKAPISVDIKVIA